MKRIIIVNQHYYPELASTGQVFQEIAEHFVREGYWVKVIAGRPFYHDYTTKDMNFKRLAKKEILNGVHIRRLWNTTFKKSCFIGKVLNLLTFQISLLLYMLVAITKKDIVLVGTNPPMGIICGALAKKIKKFKFIGVIQDLYPDILISTGMTQKTNIIYCVLHKLMKFAFRSCDTLITISQSMKEYIEKKYDIKDVTEINNMIIGELYPIENRKLKEDKGFGEKFVVMYSGNFGIAHEYETLLDSMRHLKGNKDILFYIVGGGIHYTKLQAECHKEGLENVVFENYVEKDQLNQNLNLADIQLVIFNNNFKNVLMPSKYYGILACGKPLILITDGENDITRDIKEYRIGFILQKGEGKQLADKLIELTQKVELREELSHKAKYLYKIRYTKQVVLQKYSEVIRRYDK